MTCVTLTFHKGDIDLHLHAFRGCSFAVMVCAVDCRRLGTQPQQESPTLHTTTRSVEMGPRATIAIISGCQFGSLATLLLSHMSCSCFTVLLNNLRQKKIHCCIVLPLNIHIMLFSMHLRKITEFIIYRLYMMLCSVLKIIPPSLPPSIIYLVLGLC